VTRQSNDSNCSSSAAAAVAVAVARAVAVAAVLCQRYYHYSELLHRETYSSGSGIIVDVTEMLMR
jgi:hypothetical protein